MLDMETDGRLQVFAALALLDSSRLVRWTAELAAFEPIGRETFERSWRKDVDPDFGRLICWISFATGAEFLAKGVCLTRGVEIRTEQSVPKYPTENIEAWAPMFLEEPGSAGTDSMTHFGTLGGLTDKGEKGAFTRLCKAVDATSGQRDLLFASYELLRSSVRNRDVHGYVPNVRDAHYNLVPQLFAESFNLLVSWLPGGRSTLTQWRAEAKQLIASL